MPDDPSRTWCAGEKVDDLLGQLEQSAKLGVTLVHGVKPNVSAITALQILAERGNPEAAKF